MSATISAIRRNTEKVEGVRSEWKVITPELATKWLEGNTHNRGVSDKYVSTLAADMRAGRWQQSHQGIAFDEEDVLIDGQHRLFAVIEAETPVLMQVTTGLPLATQLVVDSGKSRSVLDVMKINDVAMADLTALHCAVARRMRLGLTPNASSTKLTRLEEGQFLQRHWDAIHFAVAQFPTRKRVRGIVSAGPLGVIARAFYHEDRAALTRFSLVLSEGVTRNDNEHAIIVLRNFLLSRRTHGGEDPVREAYGKTARALSAYCKGETLTRGHLYAVSEDPYPIPVKNGGDVRKR